MLELDEILSNRQLNNSINTERNYIIEEPITFSIFDNNKSFTLENDNSKENVANNFINIFDYNNSIFLEKDLTEKEEIYFIKNKNLSTEKHMATNEKTDPLMTTLTPINSNIIFCNKKLGRPKMEIGYKFDNFQIPRSHTKFSNDNILRKIQVHYLTFLVKYVNYFIKKYVNKPYPSFNQLSYDFKKNITKDFRKSLETQTVGGILQNKESLKNKITESNNNKNIYWKMYNAHTEIKKLFNINYITFFKEVYANFVFNSPTYNTRRYKVPKTIETIEDLILNELEESIENNELYKRKIIYVCQNKFVNKKDSILNKIENL